MQARAKRERASARPQEISRSHKDILGGAKRRVGSRALTFKMVAMEPPLAGSASRSRCPPDSGGQYTNFPFQIFVIAKAAQICSGRSDTKQLREQPGSVVTPAPLGAASKEQPLRRSQAPKTPMQAACCATTIPESAGIRR